MSADLGWAATIEVRRPDARSAEWLVRSLRPEAAREVPRARTHLEYDGGDRFRLEIEARDTGALRAALNTYLGWVDLATATEKVAASRRSA
jgi:tRNA threonylcarbamoyladenosine modification (KEOPS) complex  Pcc1 subunit